MQCDIPWVDVNKYLFASQEMTPPKFSVVNQSVHWSYMQGMGASMKGPSSIDDDSQGTASMVLPASDLMDLLAQAPLKMGLLSPSTVHSEGTLERDSLAPVTF